jgi:uncharacterized DUF497 family protein
MQALIFEGPVIAKEDTRKDYGEQRFRALGKGDDEYYIVAYTLRGSIYWIRRRRKWQKTIRRNTLSMN